MGTRRPRHHQELSIPEGYKPLYGVALGYPAGDAPAAAPRVDNAVTYIK
jgi:hypothetical protein